MTASIVPLFPDPLGGLDPCQRADAYSDWLLAGAAGYLSATAAVQLEVVTGCIKRHGSGIRAKRYKKESASCSKD